MIRQQILFRTCEEQNLAFYNFIYSLFVQILKDRGVRTVEGLSVWVNFTSFFQVKNLYLASNYNLNWQPWQRLLLIHMCFVRPHNWASNPVRCLLSIFVSFFIFPFMFQGPQKYSRLLKYGRIRIVRVRFSI